MSIEIMFRAWDKDSSNMFYSENNDTEEMYFHLKNRTIELLLPIEDDFPEVRDCIMMQYQGEKDVNGIDICEDDVIEFTFFYFGETEIEMQKIGVVKKCKGSFVFWVSDKEYYVFSELNYDSQSDIEIKGNIHENPELLESVQK